MNSNIFIVIPAFNVEKYIKQTIEGLFNAGYKNIVVVDDGSVDRTLEIVRRFPVYVLQHKINRGQGAALQTGTDFAKRKGAEIIVHFDGDDQFVASEIEKNLKPILSNEADVVLGSRFINGDDKQIPWLKRKIIHPCSRLVDYFFTGVKLTDVHCGFRAMNRLAAEKIEIRQDRFSNPTDIVSSVRRNKLRYREVPVTVIYHHFGQGIGGGFKILKELLIRKIIR